jgi:peptide-methionine (S)-S-oxide reductase
MSTEIASFAAGCFWSPEAQLRALDGVTDTRVGYTGGEVDNPSYQLVCSGLTGHAEAIEVTFDADTISYQTLLEVFFAIHNPTTEDRQGPDIGSQYRSAIFYHSSEQEVTIHSMIEKLQSSFDNAIVTQVAPATTFWPAEEYHQCYIEKQRRPW